MLREGGSVIIASIDYDLYGVVTELRSQLANKEQRVEGMYCDISSKESRTHLINMITKEFGRLDVLFANAGIVVYKKKQLQMEEAVFDNLFNVNVKGNFFLIKECLDLLSKSTSGDANIVLTSSGAAIRPSKIGGVYAMTKAANNNMVIWLSQELSDSNIRVNSICPGMVSTEMTAVQQKVFKEKYPKAFGKPSEIAAVACMIASKDGSFVNGENYLIDSKAFDWGKL